MTSACTTTDANGAVAVRATVVNNAGTPALLVHVDVLAQGRAVAPILWTDNDVALMRGESRSLTARIPSRVRARLSLRTSGWNVRTATIALHACS